MMTGMRRSCHPYRLSNDLDLGLGLGVLACGSSFLEKLTRKCHIFTCSKSSVRFPVPMDRPQSGNVDIVAMIRRGLYGEHRAGKDSTLDSEGQTLEAKGEWEGDQESLRSYEGAIAALNCLQSNAATIEKARSERSSNAYRNLTSTTAFLEMLGIRSDHLNDLRVIHLAGTKGKGSTCAFVESILRTTGYKTGLYSSPHLVAARERMQINGEPLSKELFASYFWKVYQQIRDCTRPELGLPPYFMFLTVMAFHVFLEEKVDVAVVEVGIGGEYDCTNVVTRPVAVGVSSLGLDHVALLGDTLDQIAWQKAGVFKRNVPAFTVDQDPVAMRVLEQRALEKGCPLFLCPRLDRYSTQSGNPISLGLPGQVQSTNASLALQLSKSWLQNLDSDLIINTVKVEEDGQHSVQEAKLFLLEPSYLQGLSSATWPGRYQLLRRGSISYFLDGAHTAESIKLCKTWFIEESKPMSSDRKVCRVLLFSCTGQRDADALLLPFVSANFEVVIFTPTNVEVDKNMTSDISNFSVDADRELKRVADFRRDWKKLNAKQLQGRDSLAVKFDCISEAIGWLSREDSNGSQPNKPRALLDADSIHVLVTGSLHLVGGVLSLIDPNLTSFKPKIC